MFTLNVGKIGLAMTVADLDLFCSLNRCGPLNLARNGFTAFEP